MTDNPRVRFMGRTNGQLHKALLTNASLYIHGHEIGGTNPSLLEAMGAGCPILALDVEFNREVLASCGQLVHKRSGDLAQALEKRWRDVAWQQKQGTQSRQRAEESYSWQPVLEAYQNLIMGIEAP